ncbi:MAG TPA: CAP domain-containing protein [Bacteriovoracaceae bacterium]|nr:CAP domain-containing protein [Bacteriovoracaceae bacterium]
MNILISLSFLFLLCPTAKAEQLCISGEPITELASFADKYLDNQDPDLGPLHQQFLDLLNEERRKAIEEKYKGACYTVEPLKRNPVLDQVAQEHCQYMASSFDGKSFNGGISHVDGSGNNEQHRAAAAKFCKPRRLKDGKLGCDMVSGNVGGTSRKPEPSTMPHLVTGFMNSPGHRANIVGYLNSETGIGICTSPHGGTFISQMFAFPERKTGESAFRKIPGCTPKPVAIEF